MERSDESHPISTDNIIQILNDEYGYSCDRKSIYRYVDAAREFGIEVEKVGRGYAVISRDFEAHELKLLADAIQSSKFITAKKSKALIDKLGTLTSVHEARQLHRSVHMIGSNKTDNERIYYTLDAVYEAIKNNKRVKFKYFHYRPDGSKEYRSNGADYLVSPYAVVWDDEKYYLHAYHEKYDTISSFRLDLMEDARVSKMPRLKQDVYRSYNPNDREKAAFSQFGGDARTVLLEFDNSLANAVFDQFGMDVSTTPVGEGKFRVSHSIIASPRFFSWIFGFGDKVKIVAPQEVVTEFREFISRVSGMYE